ncbi:MAG: carbohydrate porin [Acidobacteriota bacterium]
MNTSAILRMFFLGLVAMTASVPAFAQIYEVPPTWGGDIWDRPRATGSWDGFRDEMGKKGVVLDVDLLLTPQAVVSGGRSTGGKFWGNADYTLNIDTGKAGLWPGGFIKVSVDSGFGSNVYRNSGATVPVNTADLIPAPNDEATALMNATFIQFLSTKFGLAAGKIDTLDLGAQEFYGDYRTQFLNAAFVFPMVLENVPLSAYGGGVIALPTEDLILSAMAMDPSGTPLNNNVESAFDNGVMILGNGALTIKPWGLVGHQNLGFSWSNKERFSLNQDPSNIARLLAEERFPRLGNLGPVLKDILTRFFPGLAVPTQPANRVNSTWSVSYTFDQYLWQPEGDSKHGVGVFFSFGVSDGNPNPVKYALLAGVGGKGMVPGRDDDSFGIGYARTQYSSAFVPFLREQLNLGLQHEDAVEMYYNAAVTKWLSATADLQIVDSALNKTLDTSGTLPHLTNIGTAVVLGLRLRARF